MGRIEVGDQVYVADGQDPFGAVRKVRHDDLMIYIENAGDYAIPHDCVKDVHAGKVIIDWDALPDHVRRAIEHAHDGEVPGL